MPWSVYAWLDGENAFDRPIVDLRDAAIELGRFVAALRRVDGTGGPQSFRGGPVSTSGYDVRAPIRDLGADGTIDAEAATAAWEQVLALWQWEGKPSWLHGDLMPGNLLTRHGRLTGVIDFGLLGIGDPACDLIPAWYLFGGETRELFRTAADVDDTTWARGRAGHSASDSGPRTTTASRTRHLPWLDERRCSRPLPTVAAPTDQA